MTVRPNTAAARQKKSARRVTLYAPRDVSARQELLLEEDALRRSLDAWDLTSSNKKLLGTSALLVVTSALLLATRRLLGAKGHLT